MDKKRTKSRLLGIFTSAALVLSCALPMLHIGAAAEGEGVIVQKHDTFGMPVVGAKLRLEGVREDGIAPITFYTKDSGDTGDVGVDFRDSIVILGSGTSIEWMTAEDASIELDPIADGRYTLTEVNTPGEEYAMATPIEFVIQGGELVSVNDEAPLSNTIIMIDDIAKPAEPDDVKISKVDIADSKEVSGAKLAVYDKNDVTFGKDDKGNETYTVKENAKAIDSWTSGEDPHKIYGSDLKLGGEYVLIETGAPDGYAYTEHIEFTMESDGKVSSKALSGGVVKMEDKAIGDVLISKVAVGGGKEIGDAKLTITDKDGNEIDSWTSVEGETHKVSGSKFKAGETYTLTETSAPDGYAYSESIEFTIEKNGSVTVNGKEVDERTVEMVDQAVGDVLISKVAVGGGKEIGGAKLTITDKDGNEIDSWTSVEGETHKVSGSKLKAGETYTLTETSAPEGYAYSESITFTVEEDGKITRDGKTVDDRTIEMVDRAVGDVLISKVAVGGGKEIGGAKLTITDKDGNEIDSWTSVEGETHKVSGSKLKAGETYTLTEVTAPDGYEIAESIRFTVEKDGSVTVNGKKVDDRTVVMEDKLSDSSSEKEPDKGDDSGDKVFGNGDSDSSDNNSSTDSNDSSDSGDSSNKDSSSDSSSASSKTSSSSNNSTASGSNSNPLTGSTAASAATLLLVGAALLAVSRKKNAH